MFLIWFKSFQLKWGQINFTYLVNRNTYFVSILLIFDFFVDFWRPQREVLMRWGTCLLDTAQYYCEHYEKIKEIISNLDAETATTIDKALFW